MIYLTAFRLQPKKLCKQHPKGISFSAPTVKQAWPADHNEG